MTEYTPTTEKVRAGYFTLRAFENPMAHLDEAEFDRWNAPREEALAAIQRVRELHVIDRDRLGSYCVNCEEVPQDGKCSTLAALDGSHE